MNVPFFCSTKKATELKGKERKRVPLEGGLILVNVNGQWLVQGDRLDAPAFEKLIVEK